jgi:hypothetical protein
LQKAFKVAIRVVPRGRRDSDCLTENRKRKLEVAI